VEDAALTISTTPDTLGDLFNDTQITAFLADWAAEAAVEPTELRRRAGTLLASAAYRNSTAGSAEALLAVLRTLRAIPDFLDKS
jgi:hypothetical protein